MHKLRKKNLYSLGFMVLCLVILFLPSIGDFRWAGLIGFIYIALPVYILSLKDLIVYKSNRNRSLGNKKLKLYSISLLMFGIFSMFLGLVIDILFLYAIYQEPSPVSVGAAMLRLLFGLPFFGFGLYLVYVSFGKTS